MIVTDRFVFLHLHKSGGTFVNQLLLRHLPDARQAGYHLPRSMIPAAAAGRPVLGLVRNPFAYYVSWYAFQRARPRPNAMFRTLTQDGQLDFAATIHRMLDLAVEPALLEPLLAVLPAAYGNQGLNLPAFALQPIQGSGLGFYSYLYGYIHDGVPPARVARMEHMRTELPAMLTQLGEAESSPLLHDLRTAPPVNTSTHGVVRDYYDAALARHVAQRDAQLIETYGYRLAD